jgi:hypothetical protein
MKKTIIRLLLGLAGQALYAIIDALVQKGRMDRLIEIARFHVQRLTGVSELSNVEKRQKAVEAVIKDAQDAGMPSRESVVNLAIELAVGETKAEHI